MIGNLPLLRRGLPLLAALPALALAACAQGPGAAAPTGMEIATLQVAGPNVLVNGAPATPGMRIVSGDSVTTGPGSSARAVFFGGGSFQLDQNTDPVFRRVIEAVSSFGQCVIEVIVNFGQVYVETEGQQICTSFGPWKVAARTKYNLLVEAPREVLTVVEGQVNIAGPQNLPVGGGTQVVIVGNRIAEVRPVSPAEIQRIIAWRDNYRLEARPPQPAPAQPGIFVPGFPGDFGFPRMRRRRPDSDSDSDSYTPPG